MKKIICSLLVATILLTSCRYPEGNGASLRSPEYRIKNTWILQHTYLNGTEIKETVVYANQPGSYYQISYGGVFEVTTLVNNVIKSTFSGKWQLENNSKDLYLNFVLVDRTYNYTASIKYLSSSEMRYEYTDEDGNKWRLIFSSVY
ncbi:MAG: hypothetical protein LBV46_03170 [Bacteroidales bacterium]|nr:hypothetical protein [Bacteroidales bacterium]